MATPPKLFVKAGSQHAAVIRRDVVPSDIRHRQRNGAPLFHRDGRPVFEMGVPLITTCEGGRESCAHPKLVEWVIWQAPYQGPRTHSLLDEVARAMRAGGVSDAEPPKAGALVTLTGTSQAPYQAVQYWAGDRESREVAGAYTEPDAAVRHAVESAAEQSFVDAYEQIRPSELEGLCAQHTVANYRLDFAVPSLKIGIEIDGYAYHSDRDTFHNDRVRQRALERAGWRLIRFSGREVCSTPGGCVLEAAELIRQWYPPQESA